MITEKSWGYEKLLHNGDYCCKLLVYTRPGIASSLHFHAKKHETFVVGAGRFALDDGDGSAPAIATVGDYIVLPPGTQHRVRCLEQGFLVEASTHDDPGDCIRIEKSEE